MWRWKLKTWSNHWELQIFGDGNSSHLQIRYMCVINRYTVDAVWRTRRRRREKFQLWKGYLCDKWKGPSWYGVNSGWISSPSFRSSAAPSAPLDIALTLSLSRLALPVELSNSKSAFNRSSDQNCLGTLKIPMHLQCTIPSRNKPASAQVSETTNYGALRMK
jgi:hypothetical protein